MKHLALMISVLFIITAGCSKSDKSESVKNEPGQFHEDGRVTFMTSDSLELNAWFTPNPDSEKAPLIVMLPMLAKTHESFTLFIDSLKKFYRIDTTGNLPPFPNLLSVDLRGHGLSTNWKNNFLSYEKMEDSSYARIPADIHELLNFVISEKRALIDTSLIVVIGASIGANSAMILTETMPYIKEVVLLSPGLDYHSLQPLEAFEKFTGRVFIATSRSDKYSFETSQKLIARRQQGWILKIYPRPTHGTDIINKFDIAMRDLLSWIFEK